MTFPQVLDLFIAEGTARESSVVHWTADGAAFLVDHRQKEELAELLVKYFSRALFLPLLLSCLRLRKSPSSFPFSFFHILLAVCFGIDSNYSSLQRQLNIYGFRKHSSGM
jgi:hypothetical protein